MLAAIPYSFALLWRGARRLLLLLLALLPGASAAAQPGRPAAVLIRYPNEVLDKGWRYHSGDNPAWARPDFDDSRWDTLNPTQPRRYLPASLSSGISWLRLRGRIENKEDLPLLLYYNYLGATELYINGKLVRREGTLSADPTQVQPAESGELAPDSVNGRRTIFRTIPELPADGPAEFVLAVRYAPWRFPLLRASEDEPLLTMQLKTGQIQQTDFRITLSVYKKMMLITGVMGGLFLLLSLLHFIFFFYNSAQRANSYFAFYALAMAFSWLGAGYLTQRSFGVLSGHYLLVEVLVKWAIMVGSFCLVRAIYALFRVRPGWVYFSLLVAGGALVVGVCCVASDPGTLAAFGFIVLTTAEQLRQAYRARNQRGAGIISVGFALFLISFPLLFAAIALHRSLPDAFEYVIFACITLLVLAPVLSISFYLAREFALDARLLQAKLTEVEELSARAITQEQEKQALLAQQNELLEQQVQVRTSELQHSLAELRATQEQLIRQEKLASVGQLTKGIVDRLLNPLNYVVNFTKSSDELLEEVADKLTRQPALLPGTLADVAEELGMLKSNSLKIQEHSSSTTRILQDMQRLLREKSRDFVPADLNELLAASVAAALQELRADYPALAVQLVLAPAPQPVCVRVLPFEFGQLVRGLVSNACYALAEKSKTNQEFTPELRVSTQVAAGQAVVRLRDNGRGIAAAEVPRLFSPFFTTKPTAKGTGLGLYMARDIVEVHHGTITIDTLAGEFTEITLTLPLASG